jgi:hypothetical protein
MKRGKNMKKNAVMIFDFLKDLSSKVGENCIEYAPYGDAENFVTFLEKDMGFSFRDIDEYRIEEGNIHDRISNIWTYFDVASELIDKWADEEVEESIHAEIQKRLEKSFDYFDIDLALAALYLSELEEEVQKERLEDIISAWS